MAVGKNAREKEGAENGAPYHYKCTQDEGSKNGYFHYTHQAYSYDKKKYGNDESKYSEVFIDKCLGNECSTYTGPIVDFLFMRYQIQEIFVLDFALIGCPGNEEGRHTDEDIKGDEHNANPYKKLSSLTFKEMQKA